MVTQVHKEKKGREKEGRTAIVAVLAEAAAEGRS
jgi:hypothetical protein